MMEIQPTDPPGPLFAVLDELRNLAAELRIQPLHQLLESVVLHWLRVVEGKDTVQTRYPPRPGRQSGFLDGAELDPVHQLDRTLSEGETKDYGALLDGRLGALRERLEVYFKRSGYRSSTEQCDQVMVELVVLSRFLASWCRRVRHESGAEIHDTARAERPVESHRRDDPSFQHYLWEPYLNDAIVAWQQNSLQPYDTALDSLLALLQQPREARGTYFHGAGYPLRARGRPRIKVSVYSPVERPLRSKSFVDLRMQQLLQLLEETGTADTPVGDGLLEDARHFLAMVRGNCYMLASRPGFLSTGRPGVSTVRGSPTVHPFLMDTADFFKRAILFDNGTYNRAGPGLDAMFLQVRQFERYFRFHPGSQARRLEGVIEESIIAWEENRCRGFTGGLVRIANLLRGRPHNDG